jgi:hypothetical protein
MDDKGRRRGHESVCDICTDRVENLLRYIATLSDDSLVVGEVPLMPEFGVDFLLMKEMRCWHVLYVFEVGHGLLVGLDCFAAWG